MSSDNPIIKRQALYDGWPADADVDLDQFAGVQQLKLVQLPPDQRVRAIEQVDAAIADDTNLRRQSELLRVRRAMAHTHEQLLKARR